MKTRDLIFLIMIGVVIVILIFIQRKDFRAPYGMIEATNAIPGPATYHPIPTNSITDISTRSFEAGAKLGWLCSYHGGTKQDLEIFIQAFRDGNPIPVHEWFNTATNRR